MKLLLICIGLPAAGLANAHPLGNNTINRQAGLALSATAMTLDYHVDIAEIPTLLATTDADTDGDGVTSKKEWAHYARAYGERILQGITLQANGAPVTLRLASSRELVAPGAAGLNTLRITARFSAPLQAQTGMNLIYRDQREPEQAGWKEVFFRAASGLAVRTSDVPSASLSRNITVYPAGDVPNVLAATVEIGAVEIEAVERGPGERGAITPPPNLAPDKPESIKPSETLPAKLAGATVVQLAPPGVGVPVRPPAAAPTAELPSPSPTKSDATPSRRSPPRTLSAWAFFRLGVHHIAIGWDHLMFLLGLILAAVMLPTLKVAPVSPSLQHMAQPRLRRLIGVVTAFTVAHSLTLGLAASGLVILPGAWVEAAIALTIAYVGLMNLLGRNRHSTLLAFGFGLIHGFGFAGALAASMGSLRTQSQDWLLNLAAFNLGIEAFQLMLVILLVPVLSWVARHSWSDTALKILSFIVMIAGMGWFFSRI